MKVINLFGSPGSGKSTNRAALFYAMKIAGYNIEEVTEYAKDVVWEERFNIFSDQLYILGKQNRRLLRLKGKVEYVVTDSPVILGVCYMTPIPYEETLEKLIVEVFNSYDNINIFLNRNHSYQEIGRNQNEEESDILADQIKDLMIKYNISFVEMNSDEVTLEKIRPLIGDF